MLMEGMYLHSLMFLNLFSDNHSIRIYCLLGWGKYLYMQFFNHFTNFVIKENLIIQFSLLLGLPLFFITPWIVLRILYEDVLCWTQKENLYISLFIDVPIGITVVVSQGYLLYDFLLTVISFSDKFFIIFNYGTSINS